MSNLKSKYEIKFVDNKSDAMNSNHKRFSHLSENLMNENEIFKEKKLNISCEINQNYFDKFFLQLMKKIIIIRIQTIKIMHQLIQKK